MKRIDLNADVGEGYPNDEALFAVVTSANIACGGHAGNDASMRATLRLARKYGVVAGAHPSYVDRENFGRTTVQREPDVLRAEIIEQISALRRIAAEEGVAVRYVKPHGALYNAAADDAALARVIAEAVAAVDPKLALMGLARSALVDAAGDAGLPAISEGFADRRYTPQGRLMPRSSPDAFVTSEEEALRQTIDLGEGGVHSICVHGDNSQAVAFATKLRSGLESAGYQIGSALD